MLDGTSSVNPLEFQYSCGKKKFPVNDFIEVKTTSVYFHYSNFNVFFLLICYETFFIVSSFIQGKPRTIEEVNEMVS